LLHRLCRLNSSYTVLAFSVPSHLTYSPPTDGSGYRKSGDTFTGRGGALRQCAKGPHFCEVPQVQRISVSGFDVPIQFRFARRKVYSQPTGTPGLQGGAAIQVYKACSVALWDKGPRGSRAPGTPRRDRTELLRMGVHEQTSPDIRAASSGQLRRLRAQVGSRAGRCRLINLNQAGYGLASGRAYERSTAEDEIPVHRPHLSSVT